MADNEERIEIIYNKKDCPCNKCNIVLECDNKDCKDLEKWLAEEKHFVINRQEAIEKISYALMEAGLQGGCIYYAIAALNALLGVEK